jgi:aspartyl-tRNA(Asn)/glutamyl-tRNA(Gln) amidotransferase subunit A
MNATIAAVRAGLESGATTSRALVQTCIDRATAASGEGARTFVRVFAESAIAEAEAIDRRRQAGIWTGPLGGIPISVKDLFDIRGIPTTAGSVVLADAAPASADAIVVARLRAAGAVIIGRTNMTEFAFSGLGLNPHFGTPANPYDRSSRRIPGGSSSGAAISVCDGMAAAAIGTDTGGSVRIPAALCGLVGFKPTAARIPLAGALPLSMSLDSIGPLGHSVKCCRILDAVLSDRPSDDAPAVSLQDLRIAVPTTRVFDDIDDHVSRTVESALALLVDAGAKVSQIPISEFADVGQTAEVATFPAVEGYSWHRDLLGRARDRYDPRVAARLERGHSVNAADYLWLRQRRSELMRAVRSRIGGFDVLAMPTVPIIAPPISSLDRDDDLYHRINLLVLRNPTLINFLDGCALSLPCHGDGEAPVGLMLARFDGADHELLAIGEAAERALSAKRAGDR